MGMLMIVPVDVTIILRLLLIVRMLAVDHVRRYEVVYSPRDDLNAYNAADETRDERPSGLFRRKAAILERYLRRWQHAVEGGE